MLQLNIILFIVGLIPVSLAVVFPRQTPVSNSTVYVSNSTSTLSASHPSITASGSSETCCFVVQDTVQVVYFAHYSTDVWSGIQNISLFITSITQFIDTAVSNIYTSTGLVNTTYTTSWDIAEPQIPATNTADRSQSTTISELNGTAVVTGGVTVQSPQAFYVYSTVKVFKVSPVADSNGNKACTVTSTYPIICTNYDNSTYFLSKDFFPGINTWAEGYFRNVSAKVTAPATTAAPRTATYHEYRVVTLSTPFIYQPLRGKGPNTWNPHYQIFGNEPPVTLQERALTPSTIPWLNDGVTEDFGYVPQTLIDWMAQNPDYAAQVPGLESCLPGGPSILPATTCSQVAPAKAVSVPDLTLNQVFTVQGEGCFHPGACPTEQPTSQPSGIPAAPAPALADSKSQPKETAAPSSNGLISIPLLSSVLHPSKTGDNGPGIESSETQQEPEKQSSAGNPPAYSIPPNPTTGIIESSPTPVTPPSIQPNIGSAIMAGFGPSPAIVEGESTLIPGAAPLTISGTTYSLAPSGTAVIVNGSPSPLPPVYAVSGKSPTPFIVSGQTVAPGSPAVIIAGTTYSLAPSGTAVIINGSPSPLPAHAASGDRPAPFIVGGETLTPGSPAVTIAGTTYSLAPSGTAVYINDSPSPLPAPAGNPSPFVIGGETVVPGSAVTVSGTTYSLATSGAAIVVNGVTSSLPATTAPVAHGSAVPTELVIGSQTLTPGAAITVSGDVISLPSTGTSEIVVDGDTETLAASTGGGVAFTVSGGAVVTGTFILPAASTSAGVGNGTVGAGGGYTGSAFVNGARGKSVPRWNSGSVLLGVIAAGQLVVGVIM